MKKVFLLFLILIFSCTTDQDILEESSINEIESAAKKSVQSKSSCTISDGTVYYTLNGNPEPPICNFSPAGPSLIPEDIQIVFSEPFECDASITVSMQTFEKNLNNGVTSNFHPTISPWFMVNVSAGENIIVLDASCQLGYMVNCQAAKEHPLATGTQIKYQNFRITFEEVFYMGQTPNPNKIFLPDPNHNVDYYDVLAFRHCEKLTKLPKPKPSF